jgi:hypothetical protein
MLLFVSLRSQSAPHPSHTLISKRKYFILCSPRRSHPPASLSIFQRSEGLAQVAMKRRHFFRGALWLRRRCAGTYLSLFSPPSLPGKIPHPPLHCFSPIIRRTGAQPGCEPSRFVPDTGRESLKVIAFDNFSVNWNLSLDKIGLKYFRLN